MDTVPSPDESTEEQVLATITAIASRYARRIAYPEVADELALEAVMHCLVTMRGGRWRIDASLRALVHTMVRRHLALLLRRSPRLDRRHVEYMRERVESVHAWMSPEASLEQQELDYFYERTLASLPAKCRLTYLMVREEELSYEEVAALTGRSPSMVHAHVVSAQNRFRQTLHEEGIVYQPRRRTRTKSRSAKTVNGLSSTVSSPE